MKLRLTKEEMKRIHRRRDDEVRELIRAGFSMARVGEWYGISKQRVQQIVKRTPKA